MASPSPPRRSPESENHGSEEEREAAADFEEGSENQLTPIETELVGQIDEQQTIEPQQVRQEVCDRLDITHKETLDHHEQQQIQEPQQSPADAVATGPKLWTDIIRGNRDASRGFAIDFSAPTLVDGEVEVEIDEQDVESELDFWKTSLIMYVLGGDLTMNSVKLYMMKYWNFVALPEMFYNEEGYFIMKFKTIEDRDAVTRNGPYTIYNMTMFLREWTSGFSLKDDMLRAVPIWIKLPRLPLHLWGAKNLGKIGSALGKPLFTDECTAHKLRVSYARILVEVDITKKLRDFITIKDLKEKVIKQPVEYEWKPLFCEKCKKMGHMCTTVTRKNAPTRQHKQQPRQWKVHTDRRPAIAASKGREGGGNSSNLGTETQQGQHGTMTQGQMRLPAVSADQHTWVTVEGSKRNTDKGKGPMIESQDRGADDRITCRNGFESLGIADDPQGTDLSVP